MLKKECYEATRKQYKELTDERRQIYIEKALREQERHKVSRECRSTSFLCSLRRARLHLLKSTLFCSWSWKSSIWPIRKLQKKRKSSWTNTRESWTYQAAIVSRSPLTFCLSNIPRSSQTSQRAWRSFRHFHRHGRAAMCQTTRGLQPRTPWVFARSTPAFVRFHGSLNCFLCDQTQVNQHESKADNKHQSSVDVLTELIAGCHTPHSKVALRDIRWGASLCVSSSKTSRPSAPNSSVRKLFFLVDLFYLRLNSYGPHQVLVFFSTCSEVFPG